MSRKAPTLLKPRQRLTRQSGNSYAGEAYFTFEFTNSDSAGKEYDLRKVGTVFTPDPRWARLFGSEDLPEVFSELDAIKLSFKAPALAADAEWDKFWTIAEGLSLHIDTGNSTEVHPLRDACGYPMVTSVSNGAESAVGSGAIVSSYVQLAGGTRAVHLRTSPKFSIVSTVPNSTAPGNFDITVHLSGQWAKSGTRDADVIGGSLRDCK